MLDFCKAYELLVSEIHYLEDKDETIKVIIQSFNELEDWTIPPIYNKNLELKSFDEWKRESNDIINIHIQKVVEEDYINENLYYSTI